MEFSHWPLSRKFWSYNLACLVLAAIVRLRIGDGYSALMPFIGVLIVYTNPWLRPYTDERIAQSEAETNED